MKKNFHGDAKERAGGKESVSLDVDEDVGGGHSVTRTVKNYIPHHFTFWLFVT